MERLKKEKEDQLELERLKLLEKEKQAELEKSKKADKDKDIFNLHIKQKEEEEIKKRQNKKNTTDIPTTQMFNLNKPTSMNKLDNNNAPTQSHKVDDDEFNTMDVPDAINDRIERLNKRDNKQRNMTFAFTLEEYNAYPLEVIECGEIINEVTGSQEDIPVQLPVISQCSLESFVPSVVNVDSINKSKIESKKDINMSNKEEMVKRIQRRFRICIAKNKVNKLRETESVKVEDKVFKLQTDTLI